MEDIPEEFTVRGRVPDEDTPAESIPTPEQQPVPTPQTPNVNLTIERGAIHVPGRRERRFRHPVRDSAAVAMAGLAFFGVYSCGAKSGASHHNGAPHANATVHHDTVEVVPVVLACSAEVSEFVGVTAIQHFRVAGHDAGSEKFDKDLLNRFPLCGDEGKLVSTATVTTRPNGDQLVSGIFPQAEVEDATPKFLAWQNCAKTNHDDDGKKLAKKLADYHAKIENHSQDVKAYNQDPSKHKYPDAVACDSGAKTEYAHLNLGLFKVSSGIALNPKNDAPAMAYAADELAMALDPFTDTQAANGPIKKAELALQDQERTYLQGKYPNAAVTIAQPKPRTDEQIMENRLTKLEKDNRGIGTRFQSITFRRLNGKIVVKAVQSDSASAEVTMDDQKLSDQGLAHLNYTATEILTGQLAQ